MRRRLRLLKAVDKGAEVVETCKKLGYPRKVYYVTKRAFEEGGQPGVRTSVARALVRSGTYDTEILKVTRKNRDWGRIQVAKHLQAQGIPVSPTKVRLVWVNNGLVEDTPTASSNRRRKTKKKSSGKKTSAKKRTAAKKRSSAKKSAGKKAGKKSASKKKTTGKKAAKKKTTGRSSAKKKTGSKKGATKKGAAKKNATKKRAKKKSGKKR